jgi:tungstate transport system substrate-binding protein
MKKFVYRFTLFYALVVILVQPTISLAGEVLRLGVTTTTDNTGLAARLNHAFEDKYNTKIHVVAVASGMVLQLARNGDVDLIIVHSPAAETELINDGYGINRRPVMHNDFVLIGPVEDPAKIRTAVNAAEAMARIARTKADFISRGDDSGTYRKEQFLWNRANIKPGGSWYISAGQGMGNVLILADNKNSYTLSDRGTFLAYQNKIDLKILFEGDEVLHNPYHVILINPEKHPHINAELARKYSDFLTGEEGQSIIRGFSINGEMLFQPDAILQD